jgi:phage baseplate assembly protein W
MTAPTTYGLLFPLQRDGRGDFNKGELEQLVKAAIEQIIGVRGAGPTAQGELPWRTAFGSQVYRLRHSNNDDALEDIVRFFVLDAIKIYEPRVSLTAVSVQPEAVTGFGDRAALRIKVSYSVRRTSVSRSAETVEVLL